MLTQPIPDFEVPSTGNKVFRLSQTPGKNLVIYFYPKDDTPGCTTEGQQFRDAYTEFTKLDCDIVGISRDSIKSHENFKMKMGFPFELLSDADETVCKVFDVIKMKNMYGRQVSCKNFTTPIIWLSALPLASRTGSTLLIACVWRNSRPVAFLLPCDSSEMPSSISATALLTISSRKRLV